MVELPPKEERSISSQATIVLVHTQLDGFYQSLVWRGASSAARQHGARLVTLMGKALRSPVEDEGTHNGIFSLVGPLAPDALIVSTSTLGNFCGPAEVARWVEANLPDIPTVSIGAPLPGAAEVSVRRDGIGQLVEHLIAVHTCRKIAFVAGPAQNPDSVTRLEEYRTTLERLGIPYDPTLVEAADFMSSRVPAALARLLGKHPDLDAVVAANDPMAIAACRELTRLGISVPRQVRVVGYDDIDEAHHQVPGLTTIKAPIFHLASHAFDLALELLGDCMTLPVEFTTIPVFRDSCGCLSHGSIQARASHTVVEMLARRLLEPDLTNEQFLQDMLEALRTASDGAHEEWAELLHKVQTRLARSEPLQLERLGPLLEQSQRMLFQMAQGFHARAHFDLQGNLKILLRHAQWILLESTYEGIATRLNETMRLWGVRGRLWILNHDMAGTSQTGWGMESFSHAFDLGGSSPLALDPQGDILPAFRPGESWIGLPLCTGPEHYGFVLIEGELPSETFHEGLRFMITNALRAAHLLEREKRLSEELRDLSLRDPMTSLLNRRGFLERGGQLQSQARREGQTLGVLYADLDGLKTINDTWGHAEGDQAIAILGKALAATFRESDVIARLGGDEFAVLFSGGGDTETIQTRLEAHLERLSRTEERHWTAQASLGWLSWNPRDTTLEEALERADAMLYLTKKRRKAIRRLSDGDGDP